MTWNNLDICLISERESPPTIQISHVQGYSVHVLKSPLDYVVVAHGSNADVIVNRLHCTAENAENITWEYKSSESGSFSRALPSVVTITQIKENQVELSDGNFTRLEELKLLNGYYQCIATTGPFQTISPTIRVILPCKCLLGKEMLLKFVPKMILLIALRLVYSVVWCLFLIYSAWAYVVFYLPFHFWIGMALCSAMLTDYWSM